LRVEIFDEYLDRCDTHGSLLTGGVLLMAADADKVRTDGRMSVGVVADDQP
jgi:hypothetical protein